MAVSTILELRNDTAANVASTTGNPAELFVDNQNWLLYLQDGSTPGGHLVGGGGPGGINGQVQFNNAGSFGGNANFTYSSVGDYSTLTLGSNGGNQGTIITNQNTANVFTIMGPGYGGNQGALAIYSSNSSFFDILLGSAGASSGPINNGNAYPAPGLYLFAGLGSSLLNFSTCSNGAGNTNTKFLTNWQIDGLTSPATVQLFPNTDTSTLVIGGSSTSTTVQIGDNSKTNVTLKVGVNCADVDMYMGSGSTRFRIWDRTTSVGTSGQVLTSGGSAGSVTWRNVSSPVGANPTAAVGLTAVNGSATTYMTSDSAPALDQSIAPTMTGAWDFTNNVTLGAELIDSASSSGTLGQVLASGATSVVWEAVINKQIITTTGTNTIANSNSPKIFAAFVGTQASETITLPTPAFDGQVVGLKFGDVMTAVVFAGGTVYNAISTATAGQYVEYIYDLGTTTWY